MSAPSPRAPWRLLVDPPAEASWNMSVDEALLLHVRDVPCLRLYRFARPSLSLGFRQSDPTLAGEAERRGLDVVRRATGGGAVLHAGDQTYAVVVPRSCADLPQRVRESYAWIRSALISGLRAAGIDAEASPGLAGAAHDPVCFRASTGTEVDLAGTKLVGSAQRRTRLGFLQHGSIRIADDRALYRELLGVSLPAPQLPAALTPEVLARALVHGFESALGRRFVHATLTDAERQTARERDTHRRRSPRCAPALSLRTAARSADTHP